MVLPSFSYRAYLLIFLFQGFLFYASFIYSKLLSPSSSFFGALFKCLKIMKEGNALRAIWLAWSLTFPMFSKLGLCPRAHGMVYFALTAHDSRMCKEGKKEAQVVLAHSLAFDPGLRGVRRT